ncbi:hypothetical protein [Actinomycetospora sp. NBC_00405]|uniref:hypothetical protein n=1 Tax=Actinomycetospora sp. NBC_00405 TaxID=2975952 RepID=UPI002E2294CB
MTTRPVGRPRPATVAVVVGDLAIALALVVASVTLAPGRQAPSPDPPAVSHDQGHATPVAPPYPSTGGGPDGRRTG